MIIETTAKLQKRKRAQPEARIQASCVEWLWNNRPETRGLYIHIPNEGNRSSKLDGAMRKALGLIAGAPDTFLFMARNGFFGLAIEYKTEVGTQSPEQKAFQARLEKQGYKYVVVRSLQQFQKIIDEYLNL